LIERKELQELCKRLRDMDEKVRYYCARMLQS
jgi:tetrahydromethanopterin S-methyltransferase subunit G